MNRLSTAILFCFISAGCSSTFDCTFKGKCADDVPLTGAEVTACQADVNDPLCGEPLSAVGNCEESNQTCDANGDQDEAATNAPCSSQQKAFMDCCESHPDAGGCPQTVE